MPKVRKKKTLADKKAEGLTPSSDYAAKKQAKLAKPKNAGPKSYAYRDREEPSNAFQHAFRRITGDDW